MNDQASARKGYEAEFWDHQVSNAGGFRSGGFYDAVNRYLWDRVFSSLGDLSGKRLLFVGCDTSSVATKEMALRGADVWCLDISQETIDNLCKHPFGAVCDRIHTRVGDAENMPFDANFFDIVVGKSIVHHLDIERFMNEVQRVCVPAALFVFAEPLAGNPLIRLFRRLTPGSRVPTEHPLMRADLRSIAKRCERLQRHYHFLFALVAVPWFLLGLTRIGTFLFRVGCAVDGRLLRWFPPARLLAWSVTLSGRLGAEPSTERSRGKSTDTA
jgi:ubiquinone/menaquinone biosynthesis C-methylase UbiE